MALALILTSLAPAGAAKAEEKMVMNKKTAYLYLTDNKKGEEATFDFGIKNKPADWKKTLAFEWKSSNEEVATVAAAGITTAVGVGTATISCVVTEKATEKVVATVTAKAIVKANADKIEITGAPADGKVAIGEKVVNLNRTLYVGDAKTTKRGVISTSYTRWTSSNTSIATVDKNGYVTVHKAGEFTIKAEAYQSNKYTDYVTATAEVKLSASAAAVGVKQITANKAEFVFNDAIAATKENVTVTVLVGATPVKQVVKDVKVNGKVATVEMYVPFSPNQEYTFTYGGFSKSFVGASLTAADVAEVKVTTTKATVGKLTPVAFKIYTANGVEIEDATIRNRVTMTTVSTDCYFSGDSIMFFEAGKGAVVNAVFHTYSYDTNTGKEITVDSLPATIISEAEVVVTVAGVSAYKVGGTVSGQAKIGTQSQLEVELLYSNNTKKYEKTGISFVSADSSALIVSTDGVLYPVKEGKTSVLVYLKDTATGKDNLIGAVDVTVAAAAVATTLEASFDNTMVSNGALAGDTFKLNAKVKDQYGKDFSTAVTVTCLNDTNKDAAVVTANTVINATEFKNTTPRVYQYKVTYGNLSKVVSITSLVPNEQGVSTYQVVLSTNTVDLAINIKDGKEVVKNVTYSLVEYKDNVKYQVVSGASIYADYDSALAAVSGGATKAYYFADTLANNTVTRDGFKVSFYTTAAGTTGGAITKTPVGTYTVSAMELTLQSGVPYKKQLHAVSLVLKDTQADPKIEVAQDATGEGGATVLEKVAACITLKDTKGTLILTEDDVVGLKEGNAVSDTVYVKSITYKYSKDGFDYVVVVPVGKTIIVKK